LKTKKGRGEVAIYLVSLFSKLLVKISLKAIVW